jgi:hypothetical protein
MFNVSTKLPPNWPLSRTDLTAWLGKTVDKSKQDSSSYRNSSSFQHVFPKKKLKACPNSMRLRDCQIPTAARAPNAVTNF